MSDYYSRILSVKVSDLSALAERLVSMNKKFEGLPKRVDDEVLRPLRDHGYWEGAAAPYAWRMIDDMKRQIEAARKVISSLHGVLTDGAREIKTIRDDLVEAVGDIKKDGLQVDAKGIVSGGAPGPCTPDNPSGSADPKVKLAQARIDAICGRAVVADGNLAFSLAADIGLSTWFNPKPGFKDIDSTGKISGPDYNALSLAMQGKDPYPGKNSDTPYDLGFGWLFGTGSRDRSYGPGDSLTELIRSSESMEGLRAETMRKWQTDGNDSGKVSYSIPESGKGGALKKLILTDLPAIATNDKDNLGEAFTGSYQLEYNVKGRDPDGSLVVQYTMHNSTSNSSFLHYVGYYDWLEKMNRDSGPTSTVDQEITWTERVPAHPQGEKK